MSQAKVAKEQFTGRQEMRSGNGTNGATRHDPSDRPDDRPEWSNSLLLLLDYAMIEGVRHKLGMFVHLLDMARLELHSQVSVPTAQERQADKLGHRRKGRA